MAHAPKDIDLPGVEKRPNGLLLDVARPIPTAALSVNGVERWALTGVTWVPWGCDPLQVYGVDCEEPDTKDYEDFEEFATGLPFLMVDGIRCSTLASVPTFMDRRLAERLDVQASASFAAELMTGTASTADGLSDVATVLDPAGSLGAAFNRMEDWLAGRLHGGVGVIHLTPGVLDLAAAGGYIYLDGTTWRTATGHKVIADAGYVQVGEGGFSNGYAPDGETDATTDEAWLYATGPIYYAISDIVGVGSRNQESTDMTRNEHIFLGERYGLVAYEPCSVAAVLTTLASEGGGGGGDASAANQTTGNAILTDIETAVDGLEALLRPTLVVEEVTADETIAAANWFHGYSIRNADAGVSTVTFHNGDDATDPDLGYVNLAIAESTGVVMFPNPIPCPDGLRFEVASGTIVAVAYYSV